MNKLFYSKSFGYMTQKYLKNKRPPVPQGDRGRMGVSVVPPLIRTRLAARPLLRTIIRAALYRAHPSCPTRRRAFGEAAPEGIQTAAPASSHHPDAL